MKYYDTTSSPGVQGGLKLCIGTYRHCIVVSNEIMNVSMFPTITQFAAYLRWLTKYRIRIFIIVKNICSRQQK